MSRIDEIKHKYQNLIEKRYTQEFLERRAKHIEDAMTKKVYVVCDNQEISTTTDKDNDWIVSAAWTISADPKSEGWETDSGESGYGLYPEIAEYYAMCINEYKSLLSRLEIAEKALIHLAKNAERLHTLSGVESYALGTLEQLRS